MDPDCLDHGSRILYSDEIRLDRFEVLFTYSLWRVAMIGGKTGRSERSDLPVFERSDRSDLPVFERSDRSDLSKTER